MCLDVCGFKMHSVAITWNAMQLDHSMWHQDGVLAAILKAAAAILFLTRSARTCFSIAKKIQAEMFKHINVYI